MTIENWKDVKGFEGLYQVSNYGNVKNCARKVAFGKNIRVAPEHIISPFVNKNGYLQVCLYKHHKAKRCYVHRLVAIAFIDNPLELPQVNHKDEDKTNNCVDNLEWCTREYNINYGTAQERHSQTSRDRNHKGQTVYQYDTNKILVHVWRSTREAERQTGIKASNISLCCNGFYSQSGGYIWSYTNLTNKKK